MNCVCHETPMRWNPDRRMDAGGRWICAVAARERQANYARTQRATNVVYRVKQRRTKLRRLRAAVLDELSQLREGAASA